MDLEIYRILSENKEKQFVKRILEPKKYPTLKNIDGTVSTHSMAWSEVDGKYMVFPTVMEGKGGKLERLEVSKALESVKKSGDYIMFDSPEMADWFSREYKQYWNK